jgi:Calpain family cysteine protease
MDGLLQWLGRGSRTSVLSTKRSRVRRNRSFSTEPLEERILPTAAATAVFSKLADTGVKQLAQADYNATQSITRNDMLAIFTEVAKDHTVSAAEISSMASLVANAATVGMPAYVANLAGKVVNGNAANAFLSSTASPTGNLFAGCPASVLNTLVANWFEGGEPVGTTSPSVKLTWTSGVIFAKGGPKPSDIAQGALGDCTLLADMAEVADRNPALIQNMFINNGDGSVTVRLYHNGAPDYVTVDAQLPSGGQLYDRPVNGVLWPALLEKAMVQENASGWLQTWYPGTDSYAALNGGDQGTAVAYLSAITGVSSTYFGINPTNIVADWNAGKYVVLATGSVPAGSNLIADHCYAMVGYNAASNTPITLFNPWGIQSGEPTVAASTLLTSFQFAAAAGAAPVTNGQIPLPASQPSLGATDFASAMPVNVTASVSGSANLDVNPHPVESPATTHSLSNLDAVFASGIGAFQSPFDA